jgi:chromosome partitioning protein
MKMPFALGVVGPKGGAGKSAMSRSWAVQGLLCGFPSAILDCDPQGTSVQWGERRYVTIGQHAPLCEKLDEKTVREKVDELYRRGAEVVVIDTPPRNDSIINIVAEIADAVLIVTPPYLDDRQEVGKAVDIVRALNKPAAILLNKVREGLVVNKEARDDLGGKPIPLCPIEISDLTAFPYGSRHGLAGQELDPQGKPGRQMAEAWAWFDAHVCKGGAP